MTKLQKRSLPVNPGSTTNALPLDGGIRYESLPPDTLQPIPLNPTDDQAAISGALGSNNPYNVTPFQPAHLAHQVFSPVSPMDGPAPEATPANASVPPSQIHAPQPHRQSMDARKSVELRRLDGSPYHPEQPKKVKVARDMHAGALPPAYKRSPSDPINPTEVEKALTTPSKPHGCGKCGKRRQTIGDQSHPHNCANCENHRPLASNAPQSRAVSQSAALLPRGGPTPTSPTIAGPSAAAPPHVHCHKCGKKKKSASAPLPQQAFAQLPRGPNSAPNSSRPQRPGISIQQALNVPGNPQIDVIPPSASTNRPNSMQSPFSPYGDETPLVGKASKQEYNLFRNSSLIRSLSRRLSGKDKRASDGPLPSQQLRASQVVNGEQGTGRLINMISKAINESGDNQQQYSRLSAQEHPSRPSSPFSFQETPNETEGYELKEMHDKEKNKSPTSPRSEPSIYSPTIIEETLDIDIDRRSKAMQQQNQASTGLSVPGQEGNRPPITRFKSLRSGVNRAASVTRATSLKRLESLKTVHTAWYRDDIAIEGHNGESVPVY